MITSISLNRKKRKYKFIFYLILSLITLIVIFISALIHQEECSKHSFSDATITEDTSKPPKSVDDFIKSHKEAYILSWKAGGFLPSASIAQTMVEYGFNFHNPHGTSFWKGHNMGGVKTSKKEDFPVTFASFGNDAVDLTGSKAGTFVGDNTGGTYTWFKDYNAGIVGKAEFMAHQSLYKGAINNTDGPSTLKAIANGGWATDPNYFNSLLSAYNSLGQKYKWIDKEAIEKYGEKPYQASQNVALREKNILPSKEEVKVDSSKRDKIISIARTRLGIPYLWGGRIWESALDCSGLTMLVFQRVGITLPPTAATQSSKVTKISKDKAQKGDLVFWGAKGQAHHVAIYAGNDKIIEEPEPGLSCQEVLLSKKTQDYWLGTISELKGDTTSDDGLDEDGCVVNQTPSKPVTGTNSAPTLSPPKEYEGKLTLPKPDNKNYAGNLYPFGQCTWGAYNRMSQLGTPIEVFLGSGGNGGYWWQSAKQKGYSVVKGNPKVGWAVSFPGSVAASDPRYGHIAVVEYVNPDGSFLVSETNVVNPGSGTRSYRVISSDTSKESYFIQGRK
ncbi:TPA: C40 family peptidase [Streptococcus agalactiae]|nr:C40 family peptidase [Streptococcus agalactiae]HEM9599375.1 C40 family peptidase [Streptococcus agalactiae]HEM9636270.1 C40 family peptidase [Streptococcus agalactiae]